MATSLCDKSGYTTSNDVLSILFFSFVYHGSELSYMVVVQHYNHHLHFFYAGDDILLPVDPSLNSVVTTTLPPLTGNDTPNIDFTQEIIKQSTSVVLAEALPPILTKLLEKIQHWEFINLTSLLSGEPSAFKSETVTPSHEGQQILMVDPQSKPSHRKKQIVDLPTWVQVSSIYAARLAAVN